MEEKNNEWNQQNEQNQNNADGNGQQAGNPYAGQSLNDPYAAQQTYNPYGTQSMNDPYSQQIDPYGRQVQVRPYVPGEQKRGNAAKIVIGVACVLVLIAVLLVGGIVYIRSTPAYVISRGFQNLGKEISQSKNPLIEKVDLNELLRMMEEDGSHVDSSLNFSTELAMLGKTTLGVDTDFYKDMHARELNADTTISLMNMELAHVNIYADDEVFCFSIPELFLEDMYIENENVVSQYNHSILAELGSESSMEDFSIDLFGDGDGRIQARDWRDLESIWDQLVTDLEACREGMTMEKVEKGLYRVKLPGKETDRLVKNFLDSYGKLSGVEEELQDLWKEYKTVLSSDISLLLEINGRRIDSIMLEEPVKLWDDTASVAGEVFFLGEKRSIDKIQGKAEIDGADGRERELIGELQHTASQTKKQIDLDVTYLEEDKSSLIEFDMDCDAVQNAFDMSFSINESGGTDHFEIDLESNLVDVVKGESMTLDLDKLTFSTRGSEVYRITGEIGIEPVGDKIRQTVKAETAFFEMSFSDWEKIITKLDDAYGSILNSLW